MEVTDHSSERGSSLSRFLSISHHRSASLSAPSVEALQPPADSGQSGETKAATARHAMKSQLTKWPSSDQTRKRDRERASGKSRAVDFFKTLSAVSVWTCCLLCLEILSVRSYVNV